MAKKDTSGETPELLTAGDVERCLSVLRAVGRLPADHPTRVAIEDAASQVHRGAKKRLRKQREDARHQHDKTLVQELTRAREQTAGAWRLPASTEPPTQELIGTRTCYACHERYSRLHPLYLRLCPTCAREHEEKREQRVSLEGRRALVTGGRVKLGYHVALKLLRDGAHVLVTTRYPRDAARRYAQEPDFEQWRHRLVIHGIDLRYVPGVRAFLAHLLGTEPYLDILVNNAAQTRRPPPELDAALLRSEEELGRTLGAPALALLGGAADTSWHGGPARALAAGTPMAEALGLVKERPDGNAEDPSPRNSWVLKLEEIPAVEMLEVQLVNTLAPFLLNGHLKPLLLRSPHPDRHIVNVSAVEGQFSRGEGKSAFHPHTNMAKAALNMMTRTSAADYARDGIYMNSVDPGWFSNENPQDKRLRMEAEGFSAPLDSVDGAARVYDPIVRGVRGQPVFGQFLKNYRDVPW